LHCSSAGSHPRGVNGSTGVSIAINVIQITALLIFTVIALAYRIQHKQGDVAWHMSNGTPITYQVAQTNQLDANNKPVQAKWADGTPQVDDKGQPVYSTQDAQVADADLKSKTFPLPDGFSVGDPLPLAVSDAKGNPVLDKNGKIQPLPFTISYLPADAMSGGGAPHSAADGPLTFNFHTTALSVVSPHGLNFLIVQACVAILILVGFESVTAMGAEAKNPTKDVPKAVLLSLIIQGAFCYLIEYFAANYFMNNGYTSAMQAPPRRRLAI